jgi:hypothetical protein
MNKKWSVYSPLLLLLFPLVGTLVSNEVNWSFFDFIVMGMLILLVSFGIKQIIKRTNSMHYRILLIGSILLIFLLVWAELAVGIFGTPFAGN